MARYYTPSNSQPTPLKVGRQTTKRKQSYSNNPFSGAFTVSFREGNPLIVTELWPHSCLHLFVDQGIGNGCYHGESGKFNTRCESRRLKGWSIMNVLRVTFLINNRCGRFHHKMEIVHCFFLKRMIRWKAGASISKYKALWVSIRKFRCVFPLETVNNHPANYGCLFRADFQWTKTANESFKRCVKEVKPLCISCSMKNLSNFQRCKAINTTVDGWNPAPVKKSHYF